jgi:ABC-type uncharacterized transport system fused permease/ATPase subunit
MTTGPSKLSIFSSATGAGITVASMGAVYTVTKSFMDHISEEKPKNAGEKKSLNIHSVLSPPNQALPTVQEVDEAGSNSTSENQEAKSNVKTREKSEGLIRSLKRLFDMTEGRVVNRRLLAVIFAIILSRSISELFVYKVTSQIDQLVAFKKDHRKRSSIDKMLTYFVIAGIPSMVLQQLSHLSTNKLSSSMRQTLISHLMNRLVLSSHNINHPEPLIDQDRMDALLSDIFYVSSASVQVGIDRLRKILDILIQLGYLFKTVGFVIPSVVLSYLYVAVRLSLRQKAVREDFSKLVSNRDVSFKKLTSRVNRHRDDVSVWNGARTENDIIERSVVKLEHAREARDKFDSLTSLFSNLSIRVGGTAISFGLLANKFLVEPKRPVYQYFFSGRIMLQLANNFTSLLEDILSDSSKLESSIKRLHASLVELPSQLPPEDLIPFKVRKNNLALNDVTAISPDGPVLFQSLSFELSPGGSLLVHGPKGCGKSALLRVIAGTWPVVMGDISRPRGGVFCVPSKPYLLLEGSLRDQIAYPETAKNIDTSRLESAIAVARISHLFGDQGITRSESGSALLGESDQQKLMFARLIYHRPKYALLDDCWKSIDMEHFSSILSYLKSELNCGVIVASSSSGVNTIKSINFAFDLEILLSNGKQPPRHEIIVNRSS